MTLKEKYGPVALIAGASEGMGAAFARALAGRGFNLVLVARRSDKLETLAQELTGLYPIEVQTLCCDLADQDAAEQIAIAVAGKDIYFLIYNAALSYIGPFLNRSTAEHVLLTQVNMITPLKMLHHFGARMVHARRGGVVFMSSLAGFQGSGFLSSYAASKAFGRILAESIWYEWKNKGVDVIGCCAGATRTPNYIQSNPKKISRFAPRPQLPEAVVEECLSKIGTHPSFVSGSSNKIASFLMNRIFSVKRAINIMGNTTRKMYGVKD
jgi:short-subunit dehydrogenase